MTNDDDDDDGGGGDDDDHDNHGHKILSHAKLGVQRRNLAVAAAHPAPPPLHAIPRS